MDKAEFQELARKAKLRKVFEYKVTPACHSSTEFWANELGGIYIYDTLIGTYVHVHYTILEDVIEAFKKEASI
jgi:hypothetical protein